jgi:hypothetical protein
MKSEKDDGRAISRDQSTKSNEMRYRHSKNKRKKNTYKVKGKPNRSPPS